MNKEILVIYDAEYDFASRLADFISSRKDNIFKVFAFTDYAALKEFAGNNPVDILLVSENVLNQNINEIGAKEVIVLSDSHKHKKADGCKAVEKYQAADCVFREVMEYAVQRDKPKDSLITGVSDSKVIAVYSPVGRCFKTTFALTLGHIFSPDNRVLYMNFEEYSGFRKLFKTEYVGDMSDLVYFYMQNKSVLKSKLYAVKKECCGFDYIPPMMFSSDIRNVSMDIWASFINEIKGFGCYDIIILDLSDMLADVFEMFNICDLIYMPTLPDCLPSWKTDEFLQVLKDRHKEDLMEKIKKIRINGDDYIEGGNCDVVKIITGGFCGYIRNMIGGMQI